MGPSDGIAVGFGLDHLIGEPPTSVHPVAVFGRTMTWLEQWTYASTRQAGVVHLAAGAGGAGLIGAGVERCLGRRVGLAIATALSVAGRMLASEAGLILTELENGDLDAARHRLPALVGRAPEGLDENEIVRAVIESLAENTIDAVVAPMLWGLVAGTPGVLGYRAINTLDAMIGHRTQRHLHFGWASARADDAANLVPARLGALGVMALRPRRAPVIWRTVSADAGRHPSPNGGVIEAAVAAALDVQLGGINRYEGAIEDRGTLGNGPPPSVDDGRRAQRLAFELGVLTAASCLLVPRLVSLVNAACNARRTDQKFRETCAWMSMAPNMPWRS